MGRTSSKTDIRAVLFDLDGTLIDTVGLILASMKHSTRQVLGEEIADGILMGQVGLPLDVQMRGFSEEHADELMQVYREHNWTVHDDLIAEYPDTEMVLHEVASRGLPMGIVTSKNRAVALRGIDLFDLGEYFDVVICADDVDRHKPDPHPIEHAARLLGMPIEETAYLGDSPFDIEAANAAGAVSIAVTWGVFDRGALLPLDPDYVLDEPADLLNLLEESIKRVGPKA